MTAQSDFEYQTPRLQPAEASPPPIPKRIPQPWSQRLTAILVSYFFAYLGLYMYQDQPQETAFWLPLGISACFIVAAIWPTAKNPDLKKAS